MTVKRIIESCDTHAGRAFDLSIQTLIVLSLITFSIETLPRLDSSIRSALEVIEAITVILFTIEYLLRLAVADHRLRFIFSFYGLIDLFAILPFYLSTGVDLRAARALRLFRVFRVFKMLRFTRALDRLKSAFFEIREELVLYFMMTGLITFLASVGIYYFEGETQPDKFGSVFHCFWWAIVTLTTVGYGDSVPVTVGGRVFTGFVLLMGIGTVAVPTGLLASALTKSREKRDAVE